MEPVLLVDDDPVIIRACTRGLEAAGHKVASTSDGDVALKWVRQESFSAIVSDVAMPGVTGLQLLRAVREHDLDVPVTLISGNASLESALEAIEYGAFRYLVKPFDLRTLEGVVRRAQRLHRLAKLKRQSLELLRSHGKLLGDLPSLEARFHKALASVWIAYQPVISWTQRSLYGYEALVRTDEPTLANPAEFIQAAERLDSLTEMGRVIRNKAAEAFRSAPGHAKLLVNLHPDDLNDDHLYQPNTPLSRLASRVVLEITERATLDRVHDLPSRVHKLQAMGFQIAVDDLGAGYAGLGHFALLEPDLVKLDMSLTRDVDRQVTKQSVIRSMVTLCKELDLAVICEGIETVAERDTVAQLGCDLLQGYLFARPSRSLPMPQW